MVFSNCVIDGRRGALSWIFPVLWQQFFPANYWHANTRSIHQSNMKAVWIDRIYRFGQTRFGIELHYKNRNGNCGHRSLLLIEMMVEYENLLILWIPEGMWGEFFSANTIEKMVQLQGQRNKLSVAYISKSQRIKNVLADDLTSIFIYFQNCPGIF